MSRKKWSKKNLVFVLIFSLILSMLGCKEGKAIAIVKSGTIGTITWKLNTEGTLSFDGKGAFLSFSKGNVPWYDHREEIKKVVFNMSDVTDGDLSYYFSNCSNLSYINNIPKGVKGMNGTFCDCEKLVTVGNIPDSVQTMNSCFVNCKMLNQLITVPIHVTQAMGLFDGCVSLTVTPIFIANKIEDLSYAFRRTSISSPPSLPSMTRNLYQTFYECKKLKNGPILPSYVRYMGGTFYGCTSLTSAKDIPSNVYDLSYTFYECSKLTTAPLLASSKIEDMSYCFYNCINMVSSPKLPNSVVNINYAFWNCKNMIDAPDIPLKVQQMKGCFVGCSKVSGNMTIYACIKDEKSYYQFAGETAVYDISDKATFLGGAGNGLKVNYIYNNKDSIKKYLSKGWNSGALSVEGQCGKLRIGSMCPQNVCLCGLTKLDTYVYSGKAIKPEPNVFYGAAKLVKNTDYTISYKNNTNAGTGTLSVIGKGNYIGEKSVDFLIRKAYFSTAKAYNYAGIYDGNGHAITVVCDSGAKVEYGTSEGQYTTENSPEFTLPGKYVVYYKITKNNYETVTGQSTVTIGFATLNVKYLNYEGVYDGNPHGASVLAEEGATVQYGTTQGKCSSSLCPAFICAGTYKVYYEVKKTGYTTQTGYLNVIIHKKSVSSLVFPQSTQITYGDLIGKSALSFSSNTYGTFSWEMPNVPGKVNNSGYRIVFTPADTKNYDYSGLPGYDSKSGKIYRNVPLKVVPQKGTLPNLTVDLLAEGDPLSLSKIHGSDKCMGKVMWENPSERVQIHTAEYNVIFVPDDVVNYDWSFLSGFSQEKGYAVIKEKVHVLPYPSACDITYGQSLKQCFMTPVVEGVSYHFCNPDTVPDSVGVFDVIISSGDSQIIRPVRVHVKKANPVYEKPCLDKVVYDPRRTLSDIELPSGWTWSDESIVPSVETRSYEAVFTPEDTQHYNTVKDCLDIQVESADPEVSIPYIYGQQFVDGMRLRDLMLPEGWHWVNDSQSVMPGEHEYDAYFIPNDLVNYHNLNVKIHVVLNEQTPREETEDIALPKTTPTPFPTSSSNPSMCETEIPLPSLVPFPSPKPTATSEVIVVPQKSMEPVTAITETVEIEEVSDKKMETGNPFNECYEDPEGSSCLDGSMFVPFTQTRVIPTTMFTASQKEEKVVMGSNKIGVPGKAFLKKVRYVKGKLVVRWKKNKKGTKYQLVVSTKKKNKKIKKIYLTKKLHAKIKWKKHRKCSIKIRSYYLYENKRIYGKWSKVHKYR